VSVGPGVQPASRWPMAGEFRAGCRCNAGMTCGACRDRGRVRSARLGLGRPAGPERFRAVTRPRARLRSKRKRNPRVTEAPQPHAAMKRRLGGRPCTRHGCAASAARHSTAAHPAARARARVMSSHGRAPRRRSGQVSFGRATHGVIAHNAPVHQRPSSPGRWAPPNAAGRRGMSCHALTLAARPQAGW